MHEQDVAALCEAEMEEQEHLARTGQQLYDSEEDEVEVLEQDGVQNAPQQQNGWYDEDDDPVPEPLIFGLAQGTDM